MDSPGTDPGVSVARTARAPAHAPGGTAPGADPRRRHELDDDRQRRAHLPRPARPLLVSVLDPHEIDRTGVAAVLARFPDRVTLLDAPARDHQAGVVLYGLDDQRGAGHDADLHAFVRAGAMTVILLGWRVDTPQARSGLSCGAHGQLSKTLSGDQLVAGIERIQRGRDRGRSAPSREPCHRHPDIDAARLTSRELDMLTLITCGFTNQEIAGRVFISINSVKTYIRTAYRKIGVSRRPQAVMWGFEHGLDQAYAERSSAVEEDPLSDLGPRGTAGRSSWLGSAERPDVRR